MTDQQQYDNEGNGYGEGEANSHDDGATFQQILEHLEMCAEHSRELGVIVADVQQQSQELVNGKINGMVNELMELDKLKLTPAAKNLLIPRDVLQFVDDGKNPECYTAQAMTKAVNENDHARERIDSYRRFKAIMLHELHGKFPTQMQSYKVLRPDCLNG